MALNVISNFAANVAHRNLTMSDAAASSSLTKLSSGQRVNSAKDDAASLAIGSRLRAEVVAMRTASVNAGQAGSMLQIADGAMATISDILVRMKELAVQASSGQFSSTERSILDSEFQALISEITRISNDTEFNGTQLIAGGATTTAQALDDTVVTSFKLDTGAGFTSFTFDNSVTDKPLDLKYDAATQVMTVTDLDTGTVESVTIDGTAIAAQGAGANTSVRFNTIGLTIEMNNGFANTDIVTTASSAFVDGGTDGSLSIVAGNITISSVDLQTATSITDLGDAVDIHLDVDVSTGGGTGDGTDAIFTLAVTGAGNDFVSSAVDLTSTGVKTVTFTRTGLAADGTTTVTDTIVLAIDVTVAAVGHADEDISDVALGNFNNAIFADQAGDATATSFTFKVGTGNETYDSLTFSVNAASASALSIDSNSIDTAASAETASTAVSAAIDTLNQSRSTVGAAQNRLTFASNNLATAIENAEAARSTLLDLDVAKEITVFTSKQVLVQTGIAMLAQANQMPQNLLRLFQ